MIVNNRLKFCHNLRQLLSQSLALCLDHLTRPSPPNQLITHLGIYTNQCSVTTLIITYSSCLVFLAFLLTG